jgi:hypothetical protein
VADEEDARGINVGFRLKSFEAECVVGRIVDRKRRTPADGQCVIAGSRQAFPEPGEPRRIALPQTAGTDDDARPPAGQRRAVQDRRLRPGGGSGEGDRYGGHGASTG